MDYLSILQSFMIDMDFFKSLILAFIAVIFHELGHLLTYWVAGYPAKIKINKYFEVEAGENVAYDTTVKFHYLVLLHGVLAGLVFLALINGDRESVLLYLLVCVPDIMNIYRLIPIVYNKNDNRRTMKLRRFYLDLLDKQKEKIIKTGNK